MSNTTWNGARLRMPAFSGFGMLGAACASVHAAAVSAYKPSIVETRNGAQGAFSAWSPPV